MAEPYPGGQADNEPIVRSPEEQERFEKAQTCFRTIAGILQRVHGVNTSEIYRGLPFFGERRMAGMYMDFPDGNYHVRCSPRNAEVPHGASLGELGEIADRNLHARVEYVYESDKPEVIEVVGGGQLDDGVVSDLIETATSVAYYHGDFEALETVRALRQPPQE